MYREKEERRNKMINVQEFRVWLITEMKENPSLNSEAIKIFQMDQDVLQQYIWIIEQEIMDGEVHEVDQLTLLINDYMNRAA
jgi:hypothetical protein